MSKGVTKRCESKLKRFLLYVCVKLSIEFKVETALLYERYLSISFPIFSKERVLKYISFGQYKKEMSLEISKTQWNILMDMEKQDKEGKKIIKKTLYKQFFC